MTLLVFAEVLLWLSEQFKWFPFNENKGWTVLIAVAVVGSTSFVILLCFLIGMIVPWRFQFSILSLLVFAVVVAIPSGWLAVEMRKAKRQHDAVAAFEKLGGILEYRGTSVPRCVSDLLGVDFFDQPDFANVYGSMHTDDALDALKRLDQVHSVWICGGNGTDAGLESLKALKQLLWLKLCYIRVTGAGMRHVGALHALKGLSLIDAQIRDVDLVDLEGLSQLRVLDLYHTGVTQAGVEKLRRTLPSCQIFADGCLTTRDIGGQGKQGRIDIEKKR